MKPGGLGKGLNALIPPKTVQEVKIELGERVREIPVDEIRPNPRQPREYFSSQGIEELMRSIESHGIIQPLVALENQSGYELIAGERRLRAAKQLGLKTVPAVVRTATDQEKLELALLENLQREDLNPIEQAKAFQVLAEEFHLSHNEIGRQVGKSRPVITNMIRLLDLPVDMQQAVAAGTLGYAAARALLGVPNPEEQRSLFLRLVGGEKITVTELEKKTPPQRRREDPNLAALEERLRTILGTKVRIKRRGGHGSIVIEFYSDEELRTIVSRFSA